MSQDVQSICAVIVTFLPTEQLVKNVQLLQEQVQQIILVDNGSTVQACALLQTLEQAEHITVLWNRENLGIARALNQGLQRGIELGFQWLITFDQDSTVTSGMVARLLQCFDSSSGNIAIAAPCYVDRVLGTRLGEDRDVHGEVRTVLTSGMLMPAWLFSHVGFMDERLFIDSVDLEFCNRVRSHGYRLAQIDDATLLHTLGRLTTFRLLGREFELTNHSAARKYYQTRNRLWTLGMPKARLTWWKQATHEFKGMIWGFAKILMAEDDKWQKTRRIGLGVVHAFFGKMGKRVEL